MTTEWSNLADLSHFPTTEEERIRQIEHRLEAMEKKYDPLLVMGQRITMLDKRVDFVVECIGRFFDSVDNTIEFCKAQGAKLRSGGGGGGGGG
ncbi:uncharacterized protein FRV6_15344 [Fusarium oxysporum]|uniref:Uncharacterized protein n=1 Tax=Fusarium oxysporum TaxID=5507 RepID=A0A2H3U756_FUSOX|nr:uncharacterized protein FRV6_15344 [Fusarium oxysporum]